MRADRGIEDRFGDLQRQLPADRSAPTVSQHYVGERGAAYSGWQLGVTLAMAQVQARWFRNFVMTDDVVLDFGCGSGEVLLALGCRRRVGIEPNQAALKVCQDNGVEAHQSLAEVPDASVDVVISNHALEHCLRPLDDLRDIRRVLKAGGRFILVVPIDDWRVEREYVSSDINHHLYTWTPQLLGNLLTEAGFSLERLRVVSHAWPPSAARLWQRLPAWLFDGICTVWSVMARRRQIYAVCRVDG